jgi:hypothetical protein
LCIKRVCAIFPPFQSGIGRNKAATLLQLLLIKIKYVEGMNLAMSVLTCISWTMTILVYHTSKLHILAGKKNQQYLSRQYVVWKSSLKSSLKVGISLHRCLLLLLVGIRGVIRAGAKWKEAA